MTRHLLVNARLLDPETSPDESGQPGALLVRDGRIESTLRVPRESELRGIDALRTDLHGGWLAPGFVDVHVHGGLAGGAADDAAGALADLAASSVRHGATSFLATTVALPSAALFSQVAALASALDDAPDGGANALGIHLEGPWIDPGAAGAQPAGGIRPAAPEEVRSVLDAGAGRIQLVTLAPEIEGAPGLLAELGRRGIAAAAGHSRAGPDAIERAIDLGLRHVTHLFNAMSPAHHRTLGVAGCALADDRLTCDLICDGAHVHPAMVRVAARAKHDRLILITDRIDPGAPDSPLPSGDAVAGIAAAGLRSDGIALRLPDGRLAGSCLQLDGAIRNVVGWGAMTRLEAIAACSVRPARLLGREAEIGTLRPGARADLVVLGDAGDIRETWVGGVRAYLA